MHSIKRYISILLAVLFLTASTGFHIIEHYCGTCGKKEVSLVDREQNHHQHANHKSECDSDCHHHNHEQCNVKFFKVHEPFLHKENNDQQNKNKPLPVDIIQTYDTQHGINNNLSLQVCEFHMPPPPPLIYVNCQLLI